MEPYRRQVLGGLAASVGVLASGATAEPKPAFSLLVVGDWGRDGAHHQRDVALQMERAAEDFACAGVVSVGDNFYEDGVRSVDDPKWRTSFEAVYDGPHLRQLPWYVALGNHDYGGVPQAQVDYSARNPRWKMPARYFKVSGSEIGEARLDLFVIDTCPLIDENATGGNAMAANVKTQDAAAQWAWLDRELGASQARYKLVVGHHTLFSGGSTHGDTPDLITRLLPVLQRHHVTAYVNGHDHDLQHIVRDGLDFVCTGAGSEVRPVSPVTGTRFCAARSGFSILTVGDDGVRLEFRDYTGASLYRTALATA